MSPDARQNSPGSSVGAFVLVVGPSGAGKDTLLDGARRKLSDQPGFVFLRRTVTRASDHSEEHDSLTPAEFDQAAAQGRFAFWWKAHGLSYGVPSEAIDLERSGHVIVCNGSRDAVGAARPLFARLRVVYITAPPEVRLARLQARGRDANIAERLDRKPTTDAEALADLVVSNDGPVEAGVAAIVQYLLSLRV